MARERGKEARQRDVTRRTAESVGGPGVGSAAGENGRQVNTGVGPGQQTEDRRREKPENKGAGET